MTVREIHQDESALWDTFVARHAEATPYHAYWWKAVFERAYALTALYLGVFADSRLVALLPAVVIGFPFRRPHAVSLPFCNYAGWLFESGVDREAVKKDVLSFLSARGIATLEVRELGETQSSQCEEATLRLALPQSSEQLWKSFDPKVRNLVRKAERMGLSMRWGVEQLDEFFEVFGRNMADLGTPVHSKLFFQEILNALREDVDILTVRKNDRAIGAMFLLKFRKQLTDPWASSLREFNALSPNMLLYWEALRYGADHNFGEFDFGRSHLNSGTYHFKSQWGALPYPLNYVTVSVEGGWRPSSVETYRGSAGKAFSSVWKILPYFSTRWLGPKLRKYVP